MLLLIFAVFDAATLTAGALKAGVIKFIAQGRQLHF